MVFGYLYPFGSLAKAAACYALPENFTEFSGDFHTLKINRGGFWPWNWNWWKPTPDDRIKELRKAGALIAAEIDRIKAIKK